MDSAMGIIVWVLWAGLVVQTIIAYLRSRFEDDK